MRTLLLTRWYGYGLLAILLLIVVHTPLSVAFGSLWPDFALAVKAWKEIALACLAIVAVIIVTKRKLWRSILADKIIQLSAAYIGLHLVLVIAQSVSQLQAVAGLMIDLRFVAAFILFYIAGRLLPGIVRHSLVVTAVGAAVVLGFGLLQITILPDDVLRAIGYGRDTIRPFTTIDRNPDFVRIHSTLRGPNPLGALAVVYMALALAYLRQIWHTRSSVRYQWWRGVLTGIASVTVLFASYSRSAYLAAGLVVAGSLAIIWRQSRQMIIASIVALGVLIAGFIAVQSTDWYSNVILHEDPESTVVNKSNEGHIDSLADGLNRVATQPFGAGVGSTGSASLYDDSSANDRIIENYYLFVAHESGWLGLGIFLTLFVLIMRRLWHQRQQWYGLGLFLSGIGLAVIGLLLPVWADDTVSLVWWGLAGVAIGSGIMKDDAKRTRQQKTAGAASVRRQLHND